MGMRFDFSDVDSFFANAEKELDDRIGVIGNDAVQYAKDNGSYHDVTGNLRRSNTYRIEDHSLVLENTAEYASNVESRGEEVLTGASLYAHQRLKDEIG